MLETSKVSQVSRTSFTIDTWTGDLDEFAKVLGDLNELMAAAVREGDAVLERELLAAKAEHLKTYFYLDTVDEKEEAWNRYADRERAEFKDSMKIRMKATVGRFDQENDGDPDEVLRAVDLADLKQVTLSSGNVSSGYGSRGFGLQVSFDVKDGCKVRAVAPSNHLVTLVKSQLRETLMHGKPWYWWLRSDKFSAFVFLVPVFFTLLQLGLHFSPITLGADEEFSTYLLRAGLYGVFLGLLAIPPAFGLVALARKLIPAFELSKVGKASKGSRALGLVIAVSAWILGSIVFPLIMR